MSTDIKTEKRGAALIVTFSRPAHANALTTDMSAQLAMLMKPLPSDRGTRALLLRGDGGNFMNGIDVNVYAGDVDKSLVSVNQLIQHYHAAIRDLQTMEKPVIAAVNGQVSCAGLSFMLASDFVIAARSTQFTGGFASRALAPAGGASYFLTRKVGPMRAAELLMLDEPFDAEKALQWGLVNRLVDDDKLEEVSLQWLDRFSEGPTRSYGAIKTLVGKAYEQHLQEHLAAEHVCWAASTRTFDFKEAIKAYFAKRPAKYTGA